MPVWRLPQHGGSPGLQIRLGRRGFLGLSGAHRASRIQSPVLPWGITVTFLPFTGESYQPVKRYPGLGVGGVRWISGVVTI